MDLGRFVGFLAEGNYTKKSHKTMKRTAKIVRIGVEKKGISQKTGNEWTIRDLDIVWEEQAANGETYEQSANVMVHGEMDEDKLKQAMVDGTKMDVRMFFQLSANNGRSYNNIRAYVPDGYYKKNNA